MNLALALLGILSASGDGSEMMCMDRMTLDVRGSSG